MAKAKTTSSVGGSIFDVIGSFDKSAEILAESKSAQIKDYIDTGNYMLNACATGSLFKGIPCGRVTTLAGPSGCGKSYLAVSICRNAQKKGYMPIYLDSEGAIDTEFVSRLGCDPHKFLIKQVNTIAEVSTFVANFCKAELELPEDDRHKAIIVLDSVGNLTSNKELNDTINAEQKRDMTKQQEIKALFRTNTSNLNKLGIPFICISHVYQSMDLFSRQVVSGGTGLIYAGSLTLKMNAAKLEDKESDKIASNRVGDTTKTGTIVTVTPEKSRFTIPTKVQFMIPFFKVPNPYIGLESYMTWENSGTMLGDVLDMKAYNKLSDGEKAKCQEFADENGELIYAYPKETSKKIVVRHLGRAVPLSEFYTPEVFTEDLLCKLDDEVIRPAFELPSQDSNTDVEEFLGEE